MGQFVDKGEPFKEAATDLRTGDLAELCGCDERTVQRELGDLKQRKLILWEQTKKGVNSITPLFRSWAALCDYKPAPVLEPDPEPEDEPVQDDPAQNAKQTVQITKDPVFVRAGRKSKRYPVECGIASCEFEVKGKLDAECSAVVKDGVLRVILEGKWDGKTLDTSALQQKGIEEKPRHGCRISPNEPRGKQTKGERRTQSENVSQLHPRAAELCKLFDPLILKWCGKSLSGDSQALLKACSAIGDTPGEVLVSELMKERAGREIKPLHVVWPSAKRLSPQLEGGEGSYRRDRSSCRLRARSRAGNPRAQNDGGARSKTEGAMNFTDEQIIGFIFTDLRLLTELINHRRSDETRKILAVL